MITANSSKKQKAFSDSSIAQSKKEAAFTLFKKKMSDKDFKKMLENEALEQREAKANINDFSLF